MMIYYWDFHFRINTDFNPFSKADWHEPWF
jgi:hypothetical protein